MNKYILCLIDHLCKYATAIPLSDYMAITVAHAVLTHYVLIFSAVVELVKDNASYLKGELLTELGRPLRINHYLITPYICNRTTRV